MSDDAKQNGAHTPGPWRVDTTKALGAYGVWTDYGTHPGFPTDIGHESSEQYPDQICSVTTEPFSLTNSDRRAERDANAVLIAEAPDLLATLKSVVTVIEKLADDGHWWIDCPNKGGFDLEKIRAVIAAATKSL